MTRADYELLLENTRSIRTGQAGKPGSPGLRLLHLSLDTIFSAHGEIGRVTEKLRESAADTLSESTVYDLPEMASGARKSRLELATRLVQERCTALDELQLWQQRQDDYLRMSFASIRRACPAKGTLLPANQCKTIDLP